jgi:hypothetical protein
VHTGKAHKLKLELQHKLKLELQQFLPVDNCTVARRSKQFERSAASAKGAAVAAGEDSHSSLPGGSAALQPSRFANPRVRAVVSVLVVLHLLAVFIAPLAARPNASEICRFLVAWFQPYLDTAYLNHGYGFFSPDPGSSFIIRYEVVLPDGTVEKGVLPDRNVHWPRLLYHRHFMLTSQSESLPGLPEAYARHLKHVYGGKSVKLQLVEHIPATPQNILDGRALTDARSYIVRNEATIDEAGKFTPRVVTPPAGEELPRNSGGPTGEVEPVPGYGPNEYRGPFAPPRPAPSEERAP